MSFFRDLISRLNKTEPARVRAVWISLVALLASVGVVVSADVDATVSTLIVLVFTALPLLQGEATRKSVFSPETVDVLLEGAAQPAGDAMPEDGDPQWNPDAVWDDEPGDLPDDVEPAQEPQSDAAQEQG